MIVTALSEDTVADPGNRRANCIAVSVTDHNGRPITGLDRANSEVLPMIVGVAAAQVDVDRVQEARSPGFYLIDVVPKGTETWMAGTYIFGVAVEPGSDRGRALASVLLD